MLTTNSSDNMQKHEYLGCFHAASATENISGVCGIRRHGTHTFRLQPSSICDFIANALELRLCWTSLSIYNIPLRINHYLKKIPNRLTWLNCFKLLIFIINECIAYHIYWFNGAMDTENGFQIGIGHRVVVTNHQKLLWKKTRPRLERWVTLGHFRSIKPSMINHFAN